MTNFKRIWVTLDKEADIVIAGLEKDPTVYDISSYYDEHGIMIQWYID